MIRSAPATIDADAELVDQHYRRAVQQIGPVAIAKVGERCRPSV
jgi:hypothetical protein